MVITQPSASGWTDTEVTVRLLRGAGGAVRAEGTLCQAPLWFRWDGATLWMVGSGASPVGEDHVRVRVEVGPGVSAELRSVAATVVYAARGAGTRWDTEISLASEAELRWRPEPVILTHDARHVATTTVHAAEGARLTLDEVLVLGRSQERAGNLRSTLSVTVGGHERLLTSIDTSLPGWAGPAGTDGARVIGQRLAVGACVDPVEDPTVQRGTVLEVSPDCRLGVTVADDVDDARRTIDALLRGTYDPSTSLG